VSGPLVGVVMGSDSDLETMAPAADALGELGIAHEVRVVSAHRTPHDMLAYGTGAAERGLQVIIAGAGGAAHLPGCSPPQRRCRSSASPSRCATSTAWTPAVHRPDAGRGARGHRRDRRRPQRRPARGADPRHRRPRRARRRRASQEELAETARAKDARVRRTSDPGTRPPGLDGGRPGS
jgi:hypothetical protein